MFNSVNQSIIEQFEVLSKVGDKTKKGDKAAPLLMQAIMVCLPYMLDGLADKELQDFTEDGNAEVDCVLSDHIY